MRNETFIFFAVSENQTHYIQNSLHHIFKSSDKNPTSTIILWKQTLFLKNIVENPFFTVNTFRVFNSSYHLTNTIILVENCIKDLFLLFLTVDDHKTLLLINRFLQSFKLAAQKRFLKHKVVFFFQNLSKSNSKSKCLC